MLLVSLVPSITTTTSNRCLVTLTIIITIIIIVIIIITLVIIIIVIILSIIIILITVITFTTDTHTPAEFSCIEVVERRILVWNLKKKWKMFKIWKLLPMTCPISNIQYRNGHQSCYQWHGRCPRARRRRCRTLPKSPDSLSARASPEKNKKKKKLLHLLKK